MQYLESLPTLLTDTTDAGLPGALVPPCAELARGERNPLENLPKALVWALGDVFPAARDSFRTCTRKTDVKENSW